MAIFNVSTAAQLQSALSTATGGDRIILAAGNYGAISIANKNYSSAVTIQTSISNPAHFDGLFISNSSNLSFSGLDMGRALNTGEPEYTQLNWIRSSSNIKFDHIDFHGSKDNDPSNDGVAMALTGVTGFSVTNSSFSDVYRAIAMKQGANISIQGNDFHFIRSDGIVVASTDGISIDGNSFTDFRPISGDHADAIQFWNTGEAVGSANISIKNNTIIQTYFSGVAQTGVQGIFISDPLQYGFKNVLIQNNFIYSNDAYNGLTVNGGTDVRITDNTVLSKTDDAMQLWIRLEASQNVYLADNVTDNIVMKNIEALFQDHNINLATNPEYKALLPNLNIANSAGDLHFNDAGYQTPVTMPSGPVSSMLSQNLASKLASALGASLGKMSAVMDSHTVRDEPSGETMVAAAHMPAYDNHSYMIQEPAPRSFMLFADHFVALP